MVGLFPPSVLPSLVSNQATKSRIAFPYKPSENVFQGQSLSLGKDVQQNFGDLLCLPLAFLNVAIW